MSVGSQACSGTSPALVRNEEQENERQIQQRRIEGMSMSQQLIPGHGRQTLADNGLRRQVHHNGANSARAMPRLPRMKYFQAASSAARVR